MVCTLICYHFPWNRSEYMQALIPPLTISITLLVWYSCVRSNSLGCYNINDFLFRAKLSDSKLVKRGYEQILLLKYIMRFCWAFNIEGKYGETNSDILFWRMLKHNPFVSCIINNTKEINDIVKPSYVKIMPLTRSLECEWTNKSPLPTNVFDTVNAPVLIHWIQRAGGIIHVVWAMLPCVLEYLIKIHPRCFYLIVILSTRHETLEYLASCIHHSLQINTQTPHMT